MRRVLADEARRRQAQKYGVDAVYVSLANAEGIAHEKGVDLVALDDALSLLALGLRSRPEPIEDHRGVAFDRRPQRGRVVGARLYVCADWKRRAKALDRLCLFHAYNSQHEEAFRFSPASATPPRLWFAET